MNLDQAEPRHDAQIAHLPEPPSLRTYRARQAPRLPAAPRTLAETGLDEAFVAALLLKSMLAHGRSSLTEIVARHGLPPAVLDEVLTFLACERLIEVTHRGLSDIDLTLRLTELGRALALEEKARNSYCGPAPVTHEAYVASVTAHSVRHVTIARADAHAAFDGIVVEPAMLDAAAASLNAGRPLLIYGPAGSGKTYLAERLGAQVREQTKVVDVRPLDARADGAAGFAVEAVSLAAGARGAKSRLTCRGVVFAASSLGTQDLLMRLKEKGSLPRLSDALGKRVRTNAESLIGVRFPKSRVDLSKGVAIGSGIYIDEHTHIEATRYPSGSDTMGLLTTVLTRGAPGGLRVLVWLGALAKLVLTRPLSAWRMIDPRGFARETMIFLCMQTLEGHLTMRLKRRWFWPFSKQLATSGAKIPAYIPAANDFAQKAARALGGVPMTSLTEILLNVPMTAHCMGGAAMARDARDGVCDGRSRVFGYRNMYVCDGSVLGANLGVNPSLTITALAEHAMSHVPAAREQRWDSTAETPVAA